MLLVYIVAFSQRITQLCAKFFLGYKYIISTFFYYYRNIILLQSPRRYAFFRLLFPCVEFPGQRITGYRNLISRKCVLDAAWICMSVAFARVSRIKKHRCPIIVGHRAANGIFEREIRGLARGVHAIFVRCVPRANSFHARIVTEICSFRWRECTGTSAISFTITYS